MKKILIILSVVIFVSACAYFLLYKKVEIKNAPPKNEKIVIFGDSLAEGVGSSEGNDLASRIEKSLGKIVLNYGKSGDTTRGALDRLSEVSDEDAGVIIIILGGNDVLKKIPMEETFINLEKIITHFQDNGLVVVLVGVRSGLIRNGRGDEYETLAKKTGSVYISDILNGIFADARYMSDAVHPNNVGYEIIEKRFSPVLKSLYTQ
jgi:lysophospholipase L1-like esterase